MFVGVICACMPSAAYAARQKDSMYQKAVHTVSHLTHSWGGTTKRNDSDSNVTPPEVLNTSHPAPEMLKPTDRKYAQYFSLNDTNKTQSTMSNKSHSTLDDQSTIYKSSTRDGSIV